MYPEIIQGGMGLNISNWSLAKKVSMLGQLGTVSGVALERVMARILQMGDPGGHFRRALATFPFPKYAEKVLSEYFVENGILKGTSPKNVPVFTIKPPDLLISLTICANYAFVWLAKEGHNNPVSINYLEKIQMPHIYAILGAMLAGVDYITAGAGLPFQIPEVINAIMDGRALSYHLHVVGGKTPHYMSLDPKKFFDGSLPLMKRPGFIPIISSNLLASLCIKKIQRKNIYGFVVEEPPAGGHNAPPRRGGVYGDEDVVDYHKLSEQLGKLELPFWIGGAYSSPEKLSLALSMGAVGIQVGTIFALCDDSGMDPRIRREVLRLGFEGKLKVVRDMLASPSGFPFMVVQLAGTVSERCVFENRRRLCDQGALVTLFERPDGSIGYRCPAERIEVYVSKGGSLVDTANRKCICNGLITTAGLRNGGDDDEPAIVTSGEDVSFLKKIMKKADDSHTAEEAINFLLGISSNTNV
ncbi:MAG: nitronate monooxygenase [Candidatus Paceibacterota bacterium]|jgi:NAD(P)H-dependent flavin oxidoreductase YrpB (nitropropane dioxygenase family)